ncbi:Cell wall integrity transcriptional regulator CAS5-like 3 [Homarus americanus]|uniref:Cell wall integrity transcriptional regulator CAS5-like 3 n=2 Tax=Homarus americanus TaxID=6706 RepID=A0A8J5MM96_HOMAM|nr:Cell wall integrity transcriptional regulator CAS5-like 3 [Homarus americanus]
MKGRSRVPRGDLLLASSGKLVKHFFQDIIFCDDSPQSTHKLFLLLMGPSVVSCTSVFSVPVLSVSQWGTVAANSLLQTTKEIVGGFPDYGVGGHQHSTRSPPVHSSTRPAGHMSAESDNNLGGYNAITASIYSTSQPGHPDPSNAQGYTMGQVGHLEPSNSSSVGGESLLASSWKFLKCSQEDFNPQTFAAVLDSTLAANSPSQTSKENVSGFPDYGAGGYQPSTTGPPVHSSNSHMSAEYNINPSGCDASLTASVCTVSHASQPDSSNTSFPLPPSSRQPTLPPLYILPSTTSTSGNYFIMQMTDGSQACQMVPMSLAHSQLNRPPASQTFNPKFKSICPECGITATTKGHLKRHLKCHGSNKRYKCQMCSCAFSRADYLKRHAAAAHPKD